MICDICHKNPAIIHIQEIGPNGRHAVNLCLKCAAERALDGQEPTSSLGKILKSLSCSWNTATPWVTAREISWSIGT